MHDLHSLHFHSLVFNNTQYFVYRPPIIFSFTKKKKSTLGKTIGEKRLETKYKKKKKKIQNCIKILINVKAYLYLFNHFEVEKMKTEKKINLLYYINFCILIFMFKFQNRSSKECITNILTLYI